MAKKKKVVRRKRVSAKSVGLSAPETANAQDAEARALAAQIAEDGTVSPRGKAPVTSQQATP